MKKSLSIVLALTLILATFAGCTGDTEETSPPVSSEDAAASANPDVETEPPEESEEPAYFPLAETKILTYMEGYSPSVTSALTVPDDLMLYTELEERLNVTLEFNAFAASSGAEVFNTLIAANDLADISVGASSYLNGLEDAIDQGIIMDLTQAVEDYMPNYNAVRLADEDRRKASITDSGTIGAICGFFDDRNLIEYGPVIRQDWLDELDMEAPLTYEQYYDVLSAFKTEYNASSPIFISTQGFIMGNYLSAGYGVAWDTMMGEPVYIIVDGEVKYSPIEGGFKEYVTMLNQWYNDGLISKNFMSAEDDANVDANLVGSDDVGIFYIFAARVSQYYDYTDDDNFQLVPLKDARKTEDQVNHLRKTDNLTGTFISIGSNCEDLELACRWLDYKFSDEGWLLHNYGVEDVSFVYNEDGYPEFTELVYANPDELSSTAAMQKYCQHNGAFLIDNKNRMSTIVDLSFNDLWGEDDNSYYYDRSMYIMTQEENTKHSEIYGDIETYVAESVASFIVGSKSLSDWDDYVAQVYEMGIEECISARQGAVDRYATR